MHGFRDSIAAPKAATAGVELESGRRVSGHGPAVAAEEKKASHEMAKSSAEILDERHIARHVFATSSLSNVKPYVSNACTTSTVSAIPAVPSVCATILRGVRVGGGCETGRGLRLKFTCCVLKISRRVKLPPSGLGFMLGFRV